MHNTEKQYWINNTIKIYFKSNIVWKIFYVKFEDYFTRVYVWLETKNIFHNIFE